MSRNTCNNCNDKLCVSKVPILGAINHEDLS